MRTAASVFYFCPKTGYFLVLQFIFHGLVDGDLFILQEIKPQLCFYFVQALFYAYYGQTTSDIMNFITFLVFNGFYVIYIFKFHFIFLWQNGREEQFLF